MPSKCHDVSRLIEVRFILFLKAVNHEEVLHTRANHSDRRERRVPRFLQDAV